MESKWTHTTNGGKTSALAFRWQLAGEAGEKRDGAIMDYLRSVADKNEGGWLLCNPGVLTSLWDNAYTAGIDATKAGKHDTAADKAKVTAPAKKAKKRTKNR